MGLWKRLRRTLRRLWRLLRDLFSADGSGTEARRRLLENEDEKPPGPPNVQK
jgi:uncharacterized membrane protein YccC